jgi:glycosyltransferase involved in cell wall biosynthesis
MTRIAFFGPLSPIPSGISDYDEELLPILREHYKIDVFVDGNVQREHIFSHADFYRRNCLSPYDLTLYQMGNSLVHEYMYGYLFHYPGAIVFHDYCLHHSRAKMLLMKGFIQEYSDETDAVYPEEPKLKEVVDSGAAGELLLYYFPFVELLLQSCLAAGAHTNSIVRKLSVTDAPVLKIPMAAEIQSKFLDPASVSDLYPGKLVIASFGLATPEKRLNTVLQALAELRCYYPNLRYLIVGEVAKHYDLKQEIANWKVEDLVEVTGRVELDQFHRLLGRSDIVVNLRYPSAGEMSATLLRALAYGKPVLMSRLEHLREIPDDVAIKVRPDHEIDDVFHNLWQLIENRSLRQRWGNRARRYIEKNHQPAQMLDSYRALIEAALARRKSFRPPRLPLHLQSGREILREYIGRTSLSNSQSDLLDRIF